MHRAQANSERTLTQIACVPLAAVTLRWGIFIRSDDAYVERDTDVREVFYRFQGVYKRAAARFALDS